MSNASEMDELHTTLVELALQVAANEGKPLDFSPDSIADVEVILGRMHEHYKRTGSDDGLFGIALEFGAYIIAVIERHFPPKGVWGKDHTVLGDHAFPTNGTARRSFRSPGVRSEY